MTTQEQAIASAAAVLTAARAERDGHAATGGPQAVAEAALPNGTKRERAAVAGLYGRLRQQQAGGNAA